MFTIINDKNAREIMKINALRKAVILACSSTLASAMSYSVAAEETSPAEAKKRR